MRQVLNNLKTSMHYLSTLHTKINQGKLNGLKFYDFHVLLQQILPLCYLKVSNKSLVGTFIWLSKVFKKLCAKTVNWDDKKQLMVDWAETMCIMEKEMPPSLFDIMSHLPNHLVEEFFFCRPVHIWWIYLYEHCFKLLKGHVRNLATLEKSIA